MTSRPVGQEGHCSLVVSSSSSVFYSTTIKVHRNNAYHDIRPKKKGIYFMWNRVSSLIALSDGSLFSCFALFVI